MKRTRFLFFTFLALVVLFVLYNIWSLPFELFATRVILPSARVVSDGFDKILGPVRLISKIGSLDRQNKSLETERDNLVAEITRIKEENRFCQQVGLEKNVSEGRRSTVARIIGRTPQNFNQIIIADKGKNDGVKEKSAVLSNGYLVGQVKKVADKTSEITLITNHNNITMAMLEKSREFGLVQGSLEGLILTDIPSATKVEDKEKVLSSGLGGEIPKGLLIGEVSQSGKTKGLFQTLGIDTPFVLSRTEVVTILLDE